MANLLQKWIANNIDRDVERGSVLPLGRKDGEMTLAAPGMAVDWLDTLAEVLEGTQTGQVPPNAFEVLPMLGVGAGGTLGALGNSTRRMSRDAHRQAVNKAAMVDIDAPSKRAAPASPPTPTKAPIPSYEDDIRQAINESLLIKP